MAEVRPTTAVAQVVARLAALAVNPDTGLRDTTNGVPVGQIRDWPVGTNNDELMYALFMTGNPTRCVLLVTDPDLTPDHRRNVGYGVHRRNDFRLNVDVYCAKPHERATTIFTSNLKWTITTWLNHEDFIDLGLGTPGSGTEKGEFVAQSPKERVSVSGKWCKQILLSANFLNAQVRNNTDGSA